MTKEITKAIILQEIQDKLKLREFDPSAFLFDETVVPVYEIGSHLETRAVEEETISITSATFFEFFLVPDNERWVFSNYNLTFYNEGAYKVTGVFIKRTVSGDAKVVYLDQTKGQTSSYAVHMHTLVTLDPGDRVYVLVDTYVSTANLRVSVDVQKSVVR